MHLSVLRFCNVLVLTLLFGFITAPAMAQNYIGLSGGFSKFSDTGATLKSQGLFFTAGGQFDPLIAVELTYSVLAKVEANNKKTEGSLLALSAVMRSPGEAFEPFLRLGLARSNVRIDPYDKSDKGILFGFGADIHLSFNSAIRLEYVEADLDGADYSDIKLGTIYRF